MLKRLQDAYEVSGLDVSSKMLSIFQSHAKKSLERNSSSKIWSIFKSTTDST
jgi:ubiquinone/menaquinone biosynthesis C-methylase UbiE